MAARLRSDDFLEFVKQFYATYWRLPFTAAGDFKKFIARYDCAVDRAGGATYELQTLPSDYRVRNLKLLQTIICEEQMKLLGNSLLSAFKRDTSPSASEWDDVRCATSDIAGFATYAVKNMIAFLSGYTGSCPDLPQAREEWPPVVLPVTIWNGAGNTRAGGKDAGVSGT